MSNLSFSPNMTIPYDIISLSIGGSYMQKCPNIGALPPSRLSVIEWTLVFGFNFKVNNLIQPINVASISTLNLPNESMFSLTSDCFKH